jgi:Holliday junction DNA helicase RuvA
MIAHVTGSLLEKRSGVAVIDVSGVGYRVFITATSAEKLPKEGEKVSLFTHLSVRETALDLFGFTTQEELEFFELLISISGIGPKSALGILSIADVRTLKKAVSQNDTSYLTRVSGIGKKNAQKIILELGDKIAHLEQGVGALSDDVDTLEALRSLGYSTDEARKAVKAIPEDVAGASKRLKEALRHLGK